jgi:hypothetical protein
MVTIDELKAFGANTEEGIRKCGNKESLYLRLVSDIPYNESFKKLEDAFHAKDFDMAYAACNHLRNEVGNLSLTPLYAPLMEIENLLRNNKGGGYHTPLKALKQEKEKLEQICKN